MRAALPTGCHAGDVTAIEIPGRDIAGIRAANPGPFTLTGTNTWVVGREPAWLIDPGPALESHLDALDTEVGRRGGLAGIALTHDHPDHSEAVPELRRRHPGARLAGVRGDVDVQLGDAVMFGPFEALRTPGHAPDHVALLAGEVAFTGDAVLGEGSVFIAPDPGAMAGYLDGLRRLRERGPALICPGHGPPVDAVQAKLDEYISHRLDRERRLVEALAGGARSVHDLLERVWDDAPPMLRPAAAITLAAHLDKLPDEGRLPDGVERPAPWW
jgi:glyoxylase-like metal-dependent hydrolase (beta-lactamase superfamily II)